MSLPSPCSAAQRLRQPAASVTYRRSPLTHRSPKCIASPLLLPLPLSTELTRRGVLFLSVTQFLAIHTPLTPAISIAAEDQLERYTDTAEGFTLLRPPGWLKVEKAGATVLFEEGKNSIGVVVSPVRLKNLKEFGTPEFVADKLIQAERRKESTVSAEILTVDERLGHAGIPVFEFEYAVDSTRGGMKRIFSAAFVASKKLYLLNVTYSDRPETPLDGNTRTILEQILHSFDTAV